MNELEILTQLIELNKNLDVISYQIVLLQIFLAISLIAWHRNKE